MTKRPTLQPLADRILLLPVPKPRPSSETIIIPETAKKDENEPIYAKVVELGLRTKGSWPFIVGDTVLAYDYMGAEVWIPSHPMLCIPSRYLIMREKDILGIVTS